MNDHDVFEIVLANLVERYHLELTHPYNDGYFDVCKGNRYLGGMNPDGNNLLANITMLSAILESELR
jgi:hypothetical protein